MSNREQSKTGEVDRLMSAAVAHHRAGRLTEAVQLYRRVIEVSPRHVSALGNLASALSDLDQHCEAEAAFYEAEQIDPRDPIVQNNWGVLLHDQQKLTEAAEHFRRALEL